MTFLFWTNMNWSLPPSPYLNLEKNYFFCKDEFDTSSLLFFLLLEEFPSIPAITRLKCYNGKTVGKEGFSLIECPSYLTACKITISMKYLSFELISFLNNHLRKCCRNCQSLCSTWEGVQGRTYMVWVQVDCKWLGNLLLYFWWVNNFKIF